MMGLMVVYVWWMVWSSRRSTGVDAVAAPKLAWWKAAALLAFGILCLTFGADWFVAGGVAIAAAAGVSEQLIGVTIVAVGTSMPELITSMVAAFRKQPDISLGNLIGSNVFNLLGILGVTAAVHPIASDHAAFRIDLMAMALVAVLLYPLMRFGSRMGRWQGAVLVVAYAAYMVLVLKRG